MKQKKMCKAIIAIAVAMAFVMPVVAFANNEGSTNNSEIIPEIDSDGLCPLLYYDTEYTDVTLGTSDLGFLGDKFYGYNTYDPSGVLKFGPVYFDSEYPGSITLLKETTSSDFIAGGTWAVDTWYGCEYGTGKIYTIDEVTGTMIRIGGGGSSLNGLAYDLTTDVMYGCSATHLYIINMSDGHQTLVGPFNTGSIMIGIAFDGEGTLYGENLNDNLYSINTLTGAATLIGPLGININYAQDMAYDIIGDVLYLAAYVVDPYWEGCLLTCNVTTGACTLVGNFQGGAEITGLAMPYIITQPPETPECPEGPSEGVAGEEYIFSTSTTDPQGEQVYYLWNWGDDTSTDWLGPYNSGDTVFASHSWMENGTYEVKVQAKDINNHESDWSDPKTIHIINVPILEIGNITGGIGKISIVIKNTGSVDAIGVNWNFTLSGGLIILGKQKTGRIGYLSAHGEISMSSDLIIGFGKTMVTVAVEIPNSSDTKEQEAFILLFFIKI